MCGVHVEKTLVPMHPVPHKIEREYNRYNYEVPCFVKDKMSTELLYDPEHVENINGEAVKGWWVYIVHHSYQYKATSGVHTPEYMSKFNKLPNATEEIMLCPYDVYIEDAMKRRGEA